MFRLLFVVTIVAVCAACGGQESAERMAVRERLRSEATLSADEVGRVLDEVGQGLRGVTLHYVRDGASGELDDTQRAEVLGMLTQRAGVFDEGLHDHDGRAVRVLNGPAAPASPEHDASRRLFIDAETLLPRHFQFADSSASDLSYEFDLTVRR